MFSKIVFVTFLFTCVTLSLAASTNGTAKGKKFPDFLSKCKRSDPKLNECIIKLIDGLRPQLAEGIPRLRVPKLEPLTIPKLVINRSTPSLKIKANAENITIYGCSGFVINKLEVNPDQLRLKMALTLPQLYGDFKADFDGKVLNFPIKGKGSFVGNMTNTRCTVDGNGTLVKEKDGEFLQLKEVKLKATPGQLSGIKFKSDKKSRQDDALIKTATDFFRANQKDVENLVTPIAEETATEVLSQFVNAILKTVPFDQILKGTA